MLRILFTIILLVHGLIHLLGFINEFHLARVNALTGKTILPLSGSLAKIVGLIWLFTCLLFIFTCVIFLIRKEEWWICGGIAILCSQSLIIIYWQDAKF